MNARVPVLQPLTALALDALPDALKAFRLIPLTNLPFQINRERRREKVTVLRDRREASADLSRSVYLKDFGARWHISRRHLVVQGGPSGALEVHDCGSTCGTYVGERRLGEKTGELRCPICFGDTLILGRKHSPYSYRFISLAVEGVQRKPSPR